MAGETTFARPGAFPGRGWLRVPVPIWGAIASCFAMVLGWHWDIQWHRCIGRDTVWTPPHISIYVALALALLYNAALVLSFTFGAGRSYPAIRVLGFRGPAGAFVTLWGTLLQFIAILFDNWWHDVYGLDVAVFSPPHALLAWGITFFYLGQFMLVTRYRNGAPAREERRTRWVAIIVWSFFLGHLTIAVDPLYGPLAVRTRAFLVSSAVTFPVGLVLIQRYLAWRWAAAATGAVYMAVMVVLMQVFQLFPATPGFGPVFHRVDSFFPPLFPLVLVLPGAAIGVYLSRRRERPTLTTYVGLAGLFVIVFNVTNWLMSALITSSLGANRLLAGNVPANAFELVARRAPYVGLDAPTAVGALLAVAIATATSWIALRGGGWLRQVVR